MLGRRVAVTGIGVVAPAGIGKDAFWRGLLSPAPNGFRQVEDWDPTPYFDNPKEARRSDRVSQFTLAAAAEALEQAGEISADPARRGTFVGTGVGGIGTLEEQIEVRLSKGERRVSPFLVPMMMANAPAATISMRYGWQGPCENTVTACAAGTHAIGNAARMVADGRCDVVMAGGAEAPFTPTAVAGFGNMTALSNSGDSRPFDANRDGFVMAEGAAILVLEAWELAEARGATILGEVLGSASTADAHHITAPSPGGVGAEHLGDGLGFGSVVLVGRRAMRSELPVRSRRWRCCSPCSTARCRPRRASPNAIPNSRRSTSSRVAPPTGSPGHHCRTASASVGTTAPWYSAQPDSNRSRRQRLGRGVRRFRRRRRVRRRPEIRDG